VLLAPEHILYIGRQVTTDLNKAIDLLAVDSRRRLAIIELKKDRTPRDMVAQALEYTAWVRRLDYDALNSIAIPYFSTRGQPWQSLSEAHDDFFPKAQGDESEDIPWNSSQIVILVGQTVQPEIIDVARYLRDHNIDVRVLQFAYLESSVGERLVNVQLIVGSERMPADAVKGASQPASTLGEMLTKVPTVKPVFEELRAAFEGTGLSPRGERSLVAFDLTRAGRPIISMWPTSAGRVIVLILGKPASTLGDLDSFEAAAQELGFETRRGTDLSIHVYPSERDRVNSLVESFRAHFLGGSRQA
jgi:hypothetical protein